MCICIRPKEPEEFQKSLTQFLKNTESEKKKN